MDGRGTVKAPAGWRRRMGGREHLSHRRVERAVPRRAYYGVRSYRSRRADRKGDADRSIRAGSPRASGVKFVAIDLCCNKRRIGRVRHMTRIAGAVAHPSPPRRRAKLHMRRKHASPRLRALQRILRRRAPCLATLPGVLFFRALLEPGVGVSFAFLLCNGAGTGSGAMTLGAGSAIS